MNMLAAMTSSSTQHAAVGEGEGLRGHDAGGSEVDYLLLGNLQRFHVVSDNLQFFLQLGDLTARQKKNDTIS